jgi:hypothetical protein
MSGGKYRTAQLLRKAARHISHAKQILQKLPSPLYAHFIKDIELLKKLETSISVEAGILDGEIDLKRHRLYQEGLSRNE